MYSQSQNIFHPPVPKIKEVNQIVGKSATILMFNFSQLVYLIWPVIIALALYAYFDVPISNCVAFAMFFDLPIFLLTTQNVHGFMEKVGVTTQRHLDFQEIKEGTAYMPARKIKTPQLFLMIKNLFDDLFGNQKNESHSEPITSDSDLVVPVQFDINNESVGCYLLKNHDEWSVVFSWNATGADPSVSYYEAQQIERDADFGLRAIPLNTYLTFDYKSFRDDTEEQDYLKNLKKNTTGKLEGALITSQKKNVRKLHDKGLRQTQTLHIHLQQPLDQRRGQDFWDLVWNKIENFSLSLASKDTREKTKLKRLRTSLLRAYADGYLVYQRLLEDSFTQGLVPLSAHEMFERDYLETHESFPEDLELPQLLVLDEDGLHTKIADSTIHVNTYLFKGDQGFKAVPKIARQYIYLGSRGKDGLYAGAIQIGKAKAFSHPNGEALGQLHFLAETMQRSQSYDYRIITQVGATNKAVQQFILERQTREDASMANWQSKGGKDVAVNSEMRIEDSVKARRSIHEGKKIVTTATAVWLYRKNPHELSQHLGAIETTIKACLSERCWEKTYEFWCQSQPWSSARLFMKPYKRIVPYQTDEATALLPLVKPPSLDQHGIHFLSRYFWTPIFVDLFSKLGHLAIFATTRAGKSVLLADIIINFFIRGFPVVAFDFPKPNDGTSTFTDLVKTLSMLGSSAAYYNTRTEHFNVINLPSYDHLDETKRKMRIEYLVSFHIRAIMLIVLGDLNEPLLKKRVKSLVTLSYRAFQSDPSIIERYAKANASKIGEFDYQNVPTLWTYLDFAADWFKDYRQRCQEKEGHVSTIDNNAISLILQELRSTLEGEYGDAIAKPTTFDPNVKFLVFALTNLDDPTEAAIMALSAYSALITRCFSANDSAFIIDETPILFEFEAISQIIGRLCANGLKFGCRVVISGQTADAITESKAGSKIMQTITTQMVGKIVKKGVPSFTKIGFREDLVNRYLSRDPNPKTRMSEWLIMRNNVLVETRYKPSDLLLALVANNQDEQAARTRIMSQYDDPLQGILAFAPLYCYALSNNIPMDEIGVTLLPQQNKGVLVS